jgi:hypothetical protein
MSTCVSDTATAVKPVGMVGGVRSWGEPEVGRIRAFATRVTSGADQIFGLTKVIPSLAIEREDLEVGVEVEREGVGVGQRDRAAVVPVANERIARVRVIKEHHVAKRVEGATRGRPHYVGVIRETPDARSCRGLGPGVRQRLLRVATRRADLSVIALVVVRVDVRRGIGQVQFESVSGRGREVDVAVAEAKKVNVAMTAAPF